VDSPINIPTDEKSSMNLGVFKRFYFF
jgi:hypothetical protein